MKITRKILSSTWFIHLVVGLGLLALWGYIEIGNKYLLLFMALSFSGAMCGAFVKVIDTIKSK